MREVLEALLKMLTPFILIGGIALFYQAIKWLGISTSVEFFAGIFCGMVLMILLLLGIYPELRTRRLGEGVPILRAKPRHEI